MNFLSPWAKTHPSTLINAFGCAFIISVLLTWGVIHVATKRGWVAKPRAQRWHTRPTALFGGLALFGSCAIASFFFLPGSPAYWPLVVGGVLMFGAGLWDDLREMTPRHKIYIQLAAALWFITLYYNASPPQQTWLIPIALVWLIGIINAVNLLDNMDGLSTGVSAIGALFMAAYALHIGDAFVAVGGLIIAGACLGFLVWNFNPAKIFMGDCGALFLGFCLGGLSLASQTSLQSSNFVFALLLPVLVLATPLFDTLFVAMVRFINDRPVLLGGRDHTSHRLVMLGLSERRAVLWLYGVALWFGLLGIYGVTHESFALVIALTLLSWIGMLVLGLFLSEVKAYDHLEEDSERKRRGSRILARHRRRILDAFLDITSIGASWTLAFLLRYEDAPFDHLSEMATTLPFVMVCVFGAFFLTGIYHSLWRYVTLSDLFVLGRTALIGCVATWLACRFFLPHIQLSTSVLVIFFLLLIASSGGFRLGFKALRYHFSLHYKRDVKRVLVFGAGDMGELVVREMLLSAEAAFQPVGFIDDDPQKQRLSIHGVKVLGTRNQLLEMIARHRIDEVLIALTHGSPEVASEVRGMCQTCGVGCREVRRLAV
ncbi:hypothetical protein EON83_07150 [bacterium]|nr:MAG: hypothetical protein EON83_07150 [bacterium]